MVVLAEPVVGHGIGCSVFEISAFAMVVAGLGEGLPMYQELQGVVEGRVCLDWFTVGTVGCRYIEGTTDNCVEGCSND
jgi:hypothetical protein